MNKSGLAVLSLFSFLLIFSSISVAQLGEVAGQPTVNVSIGSSNSVIITVVNQAGTPLPVKVILPSLVSKDANAITPTVSANPLEGNVPAGGDLHINLTVYMPGGTNKPGYTWTGIMQIVTVPTTSGAGAGGGAAIIEGVAKIVTVNAAQHISSIWDYLWIIVLVVVIVVVAIVVLIAKMKGMLGGKKAKK
jgi:hypothetical protein